MATSTLLRALRRSSYPLPLALAQSRHLQLAGAYKFTTNRHLSVFKEFSKHLKGEANSNPKFQKSVKELNEKIGAVTEDLKVRTKTISEKVSKSVDEVWTEAEETSKKVSANVKEKISAAKEEVKETFGLGTEQTTEGTSQGSEPNPNRTNASSSESSSQDASTANPNQQGQFGYEDIFSKLKSTVSSASPAVSSAFQKLKDAKVLNLAKNGFEMVKDELSSDSKTRAKRMKQAAAAAAASGERSTRTEVVLVPTKRSMLGEKWEALKQKMQGHPIFKKVTGYTKPVVNKSQEIAEDMRERWETSDSPVVHKIQDLNETVFGETATALSFKEIRRRDPSFSLPDFVSDVQEIIHPVLTSYHKGDVVTLKKYCTKEVLERCKGERTAYESQGMFFDKKILHISEVDVRETKMMGSTPIIIISFQTQQIYCVRDRQGEIKDGGKDTIHTVYYAWAMQLMDADEAGEESYFPVWRLREMQEQGVQALI